MKGQTKFKPNGKIKINLKSDVLVFNYQKN